MKSIVLKNIAFVILVAATVVSCSKQDSALDPVSNLDVHEEELITTVSLLITNSTGFAKTFSYKVENGVGSAMPIAPVVDDIVLDANTEYYITIDILNESVDPTEDVTEEIVAESNDHLFFFESKPSGGNNGEIVFLNGNKDNNGEPFNRTGIINTKGSGQGELIVTLKHKPVNKNAITPDAAGGETDAVAVFPVSLN